MQDSLALRVKFTAVCKTTNNKIFNYNLNIIKRNNYKIYYSCLTKNNTNFLKLNINRRLDSSEYLSFK